jgi:hypothetical protein
MTHGIFTSTGNLVAWFDTDDEALAALSELVAEEPEAADEIAAIPFDDEGHSCGPAIEGSTAAAAERRRRLSGRPGLFPRLDGLSGDPFEQRLLGEQRPPADLEERDAAAAGELVHGRSRNPQQLGDLLSGHQTRHRIRHESAPFRAD